MPTRWHAVPRRQPYINTRNGMEVSPSAGSTNALRLEMFAGDCLDLLKKSPAFGLLVDPAHEFFYMKHMTGINTKSHAVLAIARMHYQWLLDAGIEFENDSFPDHKRRCEVSPLVSYAGEELTGQSGLKAMSKMVLPFHVSAPLEDSRVPRTGGAEGANLEREVTVSLIDPAGELEHHLVKVQEQQISHLAARPVDCTAFAEGYCEALDSDDDAALCSTPSSLRSDREHWEEKLQQKLAEAMEEIRLRKEAEAGTDIEMAVEKDDDDDGFGESDEENEDQEDDDSDSGRKKKRGSGVKSPKDRRTTKHGDKTKKRSRHSVHGILEEDEPIVQCIESEIFSRVLKEGHSKRMISIGRRSSLNARVQGGYGPGTQRRMKFTSRAFRIAGGNTVFNKGSDYKAPPKVDDQAKEAGLIEQAGKRTRDVYWKNPAAQKALAYDTTEGLFSDKKENIPAGIRKYQWVAKPPVG
eukprot:gnl/TRDRNA2_/TRDRNA2_166546_c2_seq1.p1 gnl/TRDRNA2_/TRDRNA2_166546_c2~~gnl/TRDRNA2_/TRDRNA2_166546_c2_seq1.p1  ORF type:complete len:467 (+),score=77.92 gnl/TRDRNA2_/TRDRNA2_166546_c2_seq1:627-2027(+)